MLNKDDSEMTSNKEHKTAVPIELMNIGHHYDKFLKGILKTHYSTSQQDKLQSSLIHNFVVDGHLERSLFRKRMSID